MRPVDSLLAAASHVWTALFCAVLGVVLGAAACGTFEGLVVLPAMVGACVAVLVLFALLARSAGRRLVGSDVVRDDPPGQAQLREDVLENR